MKKFYLLFISIFLSVLSYGATWTTVSNGFWNTASIWQGGIVPPYSNSDTFRIKHPVVFENSLVFNSGSLVKIDSTGGLCGHHTISVFTNARIIKHGILEADSLLIPGGIVNCNATGAVVLTQTAILTVGGSLTISGCSFSVGPWFNCVQPEYHFAIGIEEEMIENNIRIFPNPSNGIFEISEDNFRKETQLIIIDVLGRILYNRPLDTSSKNRSIDISFLDNGIYSWVLFSDDKKFGRGKIEIIK